MFKNTKIIIKDDRRKGFYVIYTRDIYDEEQLNILRDILRDFFKDDSKKFLALPSEKIKRIKFFERKYDEET